MNIHSRALWLGLALLFAVCASLIPSLALASDPAPVGPPLEFFGVIQQLPNTPGWIGDWKVNHLTAHVNQDTVIDTTQGTVAVGAFVRISGRMQSNGTLIANRIEVRAHAWQVQFFGVIQSLPPDPQNGDWKVNHLTVHVTSSTVISPNVAAAKVGAYVHVNGIPQTDGSINASRITILTPPNNDNHVKFIGVVTALPPSADLIGDWTISAPLSATLANVRSFPIPLPVTRTVTVHVTPATHIDQTRGPVKLGVLVKVEGIVKNDLTVDAGDIEVIFVPPDPGNTIDFLGRIEQLPNNTLIGDWIVSGRTVHVTGATTIDQTRAQAAVGAFVRVKGTAQSDRTVNATAIEVRANPVLPPNRYVKFYGIVQAVPSSGIIGDYKVSGLTVHVTSADQIVNGPIRVNAIVEVKGTLQTDGSINAIRIEMKGTRPGTTSPFGTTSAIGHVGQ